MAYPKDTPLIEAEFIGVDNRFYFQEDLAWGGPTGDGKAEIRLERTEEEHDCVECDGQTVEIPGIECDRAVIAGACAWGYFREKFRVVFDDGTAADAEVNFFDWAWSVGTVIGTSMEAESGDFECGVLKEYERRDGQAFIYYNVTELPEPKRVKQIVFPDNICMFIFGITLEAV
ncbi:MAG: hypothetical protein LBL66_04010 [Clostridiales bacterium]|nr:hypothetical protein [Clostridiales bacterium]